MQKVTSLCINNMALCTNISEKNNTIRLTPAEIAWQLGVSDFYFQLLASTIVFPHSVVRVVRV